MSKMKKPTTIFRILNILFNGGSFPDVVYLFLTMLSDSIEHSSKSTKSNKKEDNNAD